ADRDGRALRHVIGAERFGGRLRRRARRHDEEVVVTAGDAVLGAAAVALDIDRPAPRRAQIVFREKRKSDREGVESRAELRARPGHTHAELPHCSDLNARRTASIAPPDSSRAATAPFHDAGFPTRMAVATVSGSATGLPRTIGAAPSA